MANTTCIDEKSTKVLVEPVEVYNLTVEGPEHNYFASGILVHNKSEKQPIDTPPNVFIEAPMQGTEHPTYNDVEMRGTIYDDWHENDGLSIQWAVDDEPICTDAILGIDSSTTCSFVFTEPGEFVITLEATNPMDLTGIDNVSIVISENALAEGNITSPTADGEYFSETPILFSVEVSHDLLPPEDLWVEWESDNDGVLGGGHPDSSGLFEEMYTLSQGEHQITLRVSEQQLLEQTLVITVF